MLPKKSIISINVSHGAEEDILNKLVGYSTKRQSSYICFANVHMLIEAYNSDTFKEVVNNADIVAPDGLPIAKCLSLLHGIKQQRIDGTSIMLKLLARCEKTGEKVFFFGGTEEMLGATKKYLQINYPTIVLAGMHAPPFRILTVAEKEKIISEITLSNASYVFVVLGCPKQERWMHEMKGKIPAVMLGIGGALPMILGINKKAPTWMQKNGLEWMYRLMQEPRRLFRRYAVTNTKFLYLLSKEIIKRKLTLFEIQ